MTENEKRDRFVSELRMLADLYEQNPGLDLPFEPSVQVFPGGVEGLAAFARAVGRADKRVDDRNSLFYLTAKGFEAIKFEAIEARDAVCTRRVVGTETVTKRVHDPSVPLVEVTEEVEVVEWDCAPSILAAAQ